MLSKQNGFQVEMEGEVEFLTLSKHFHLIYRDFFKLYITVWNKNLSLFLSLLLQVLFHK